MSGFLTLGSLTFLRVAIVRRTGPARLLRVLDYSRAAGPQKKSRLFQEELALFASSHRLSAPQRNYRACRTTRPQYLMHS